MYTFMDISLDLKNRMDAIRKKYYLTMAHHSFASLYMWQKELKTSICIKKDFFVLKEGSKHEHFYYFPCGNPKKKIAFIRYALKKHGSNLCLGYMSEADKYFLAEHFKGKFLIEEDRDSYEYLYLLEEQKRAYGGRFKYLRKEVNHANKTMKLTYEKITAHNMEEVKRVTMEWNRLHMDSFDDYYGDVKPTLIMLAQFHELNLFGILIRNEDKACSYVIGAELSENTVEILMTKCSLPGNGLDFFSKLIFYHTLENRFQYINQEDDMGINGIREKKLAQHPIGLTAVWKGSGE